QAKRGGHESLYVQVRQSARPDIGASPNVWLGLRALEKRRSHRERRRLRRCVRGSRQPAQGEQVRRALSKRTCTVSVAASGSKRPVRLTWLTSCIHSVPIWLPPAS